MVPVFANDWGNDEVEEFGKGKVCNVVDVFSEYVSECRKDKMFSDWFCMKRVTKFAVTIIYSAKY